MKANRVPLTTPVLTGSEKTGSFRRQCQAGASGEEVLRPEYRPKIESDLPEQRHSNLVG
jgi:hypothetical protein